MGVCFSLQSGKSVDPSRRSSWAFPLRSVPVIASGKTWRARADSALVNVELPMLRIIHLCAGKVGVGHGYNPIGPMPRLRKFPVAA